MRKEPRIDDPRRAETPTPGQPGAMAPPDSAEPRQPDAQVGLTQGVADTAEEDENGEADFVTSTPQTLENEPKPVPPDDKR